MCFFPPTFMSIPTFVVYFMAPAFDSPVRPRLSTVGCQLTVNFPGLHHFPSSTTFYFSLFMNIKLEAKMFDLKILFTCWKIPIVPSRSANHQLMFPSANPHLHTHTHIYTPAPSYCNRCCYLFSNCYSRASGVMQCKLNTHPALTQFKMLLLPTSANYSSVATSFIASWNASLAVFTNEWCQVTQYKWSLRTLQVTESWLLNIAAPSSTLAMFVKGWQMHQHFLKSSYFPINTTMPECMFPNVSMWESNVKKLNLLWSKMLAQCGWKKFICISYQHLLV